MEGAAHRDRDGLGRLRHQSSFSPSRASSWRYVGVTDPLLILRSEFPILERTTYLVSNSLGAMPRGVPERLAEYVDQWAELGVRAWAGDEGWWQMPVSVGNEIAPLIGAGH